MRKYDKYSYIFPPRPEHKISSDSLVTYDTNEYLGQPKLDGSCCVLFVKGKDVIAKNRHNARFWNIQTFK